MSKLNLALKLADETGTTVAKAQKYIDDVGMDLARKSLDDAAESASSISPDWWKVAAGGGAVGGTAYAFKQAEVNKAKQIANQNQATSDAIADIMDSDMSPKAKQALVKSLMNSNGSDDNKADDGLLPGDTQTTIILLIVLVFGMKFALDGGDE